MSTEPRLADRMKLPGMTFLLGLVVTTIETIPFYMTGITQGQSCYKTTAAFYSLAQIG